MGDVLKSGMMEGWVQGWGVDGRASWTLSRGDEIAVIDVEDDGYRYKVLDASSVTQVAGGALLLNDARDAVLAWLDKRQREEPTKDTDPLVETPPHYQGAIECIDAIDAMVEGYSDKRAAYYAGQAMRYLWRVERKGKPVQDAQKARWYVERLIAREEEVNA